MHAWSTLAIGVAALSALANAAAVAQPAPVPVAVGRAEDVRIRGRVARRADQNAASASSSETASGDGRFAIAQTTYAKGTGVATTSGDTNTGGANTVHAQLVQTGPFLNLLELNGEVDPRDKEVAISPGSTSHGDTGASSIGVAGSREANGAEVETTTNKHGISTTSNAGKGVTAKSQSSSKGGLKGVFSWHRR